MSMSVYRSGAGRQFYETENVIWAGFGPIGNTGRKMFDSHLLRTVFFMFLGAKKIDKKKFENVVASTLKSCII